MKDYSNYFKKPSLNEAKRRSRNEIGRYDDVYHVPADMVKAGVSIISKHMDVKLMNVIVKHYLVY